MLILNFLIEHFVNKFSPELSAITGKSVLIDGVFFLSENDVIDLMELIVQISFHICFSWCCILAGLFVVLVLVVDCVIKAIKRYRCKKESALYKGAVRR